MNTETWSNIAKERVRLPIRHKGCGLREARDRGFVKFLGETAQSLMHLMDRVDKEGNTIRGRYDTQPIRSLFGEGAFNSPFDSP